MIAEVNVALQTECRLLREVVEAEHRVVDGEDHQGRRPTLVLEHVVVELLFLDHGVLAVEGADLHVDGDHRGAFPEDAHDARVAVLPQRPHDVGRVGHLDGPKLRGQHGENVGAGHGHLDRAHVEHGVSKGEHAAAVVVGNRPQARGGGVAGNQDGRDRLAGFQFASVARLGRAGGGTARGTTYSPALHDPQPGLAEEAAEDVEHAVMHSGENQRRLDRRGVGIGGQLGVHCLPDLLGETGGWVEGRDIQRFPRHAFGAAVAGVEVATR